MIDITRDMQLLTTYRNNDLEFLRQLKTTQRLIILCCSRFVLVAATTLSAGSVKLQARQAVCASAPKVLEIHRRVSAIDRVFDAPQSAGWRRVENRSSHWVFSGLFENDAPVFVSGEFSEGELVRRESYYFFKDALMLAVVDRAWDVDDPRKAPEPEKVQELYFDQAQSVCFVQRIFSKRPTVHSDLKSSPSGNLIERAHRIATILGTKSAAEIRSMAVPLEKFPEVEATQ